MNAWPSAIGMNSLDAPAIKSLLCVQGSSNGRRGLAPICPVSSLSVTLGG